MKIYKVYVPIFIIGILININLVCMKPARGSERYKDFIREVSKVKSNPVILSGWYYEMGDLNEQQDALRIATVKGINISGQEEAQKKIKDQLLKDNIKNIEEGQMLKALPKDMNLQISKLYFSNLIKRTDFQNEKELVDSLNEFNKASKVTNQVVREYLKKLSQTDQKYANLIVAGDPVKTFAKQFTALKLDLINKIILKITNNNSLEEILKDAALKFEAYNWSKIFAKNNKMYSDFLSKALRDILYKGYNDPSFNSPKDYSDASYSDKELQLYLNARTKNKEIEDLLKLGANPNQHNIYYEPSKPINSPLSLVASNLLFSPELFELLIQYGGDVNLATFIENMPLGALVEFASYYADSQKRLDSYLIKLKILLEHGANPNLKSNTNGKTPLELAKEELKRRISGMSYADQAKYKMGLSISEDKAFNIKTLTKFIELMNNADKIRQDF